MNLFSKFILIQLFLLGFFNFNAKAIYLTICYENTEQPPYYYGKDLKILNNNPGISVEMVLMLEKKIPDLYVKFKRVPWSRCKGLLSRNKVDGIFNSSYKTSRLKLGWYPTLDKTHKGAADSSKRITTLTYSFYTLKNNKLEWDGKDYSIIKGPVGANLGFSIVDDLEKRDIKVFKSATTKINFVKLVDKTIDIVAAQDVLGDSLLKNPKFKDIVKIKPPIITKNYYLMLSDSFVKNNTSLAYKIWDTIEVIRENEFDNILKKY